MWKGGKTISSHGYILVRIYPDRKGASAYRYEHDLVMEQLLGRPLKKGEEVHHKDENKQNNTPSNLELQIKRKYHKLHHRKENSNRQLPDEKNVIIICKCGCGISLSKYDKYGRPRDFISGHNRRGFINS